MGFYLSQEKCFISTCSRQGPSGEMASAWVGGPECQVSLGCVHVCAHVCVLVCFCKSIATLVVSLHHVRCFNCSQLAPHETTASRFGECSFLSVGGARPRVPATACGSRSSLCVCVHIEFLQCCRAPGRGAM